MFTKTAPFYDEIYAARGKDYDAEARWLRASIASRVSAPDARLLDVACGTGRHLLSLRGAYAIEGLDADPAMIELARKRLPDVPLHVARMQDFTLPHRFGAIVCLFGSIAYVDGVADLRATFANVRRHLEPGGVFILEPWLSPADWRDDVVQAIFVDRPELKLARITRSSRRGDSAILQMAYLVGESGEIDSFNEVHVLDMFTHGMLRDALGECGFEVQMERSDLFPRGLFVATRP